MPAPFAGGEASIAAARAKPARRAVRRRWQFAQTTSHFAISSRTSLQPRSRRALRHVELLVTQVVELEHHGIGLAAVAHGCARKSFTTKNRVDWIRTSDRSAPSRVRYQTAPRPEAGYSILTPAS